MLNLLKKFLNLSFSDQWILAKTFTVTSILRLLLKTLSFQHFRFFFTKTTNTKNTLNHSSEEIKKIVWAIDSVSPIVSANCLPQALSLKYFLRKDKTVKLLIGTSLTNGFAAHAWVEKEGKILIGDVRDSDFQFLWNWE